MNIKKSVAGLIAGFALLGSIAAPAALASDASTTATVIIGVGGNFSVSICSVSLNEQTPPTAETPGIATGIINICYVDTKSYRPGFDVGLSASDFSDGNGHTIDNAGFKVTQTNNVTQTLWTNMPPPTVRLIRALGTLGISAPVVTWRSTPTTSLYGRLTTRSTLFEMFNSPIRVEERSIPTAISMSH